MAATMTDEERSQKRRENALRLLAEGKIGPQYGKLGGRPRKKKKVEREETESDLIAFLLVPIRMPKATNNYIEPVS